ncbi:uncharacterized protein LOC144715980 [Wolffia australiana]
MSRARFFLERNEDLELRLAPSFMAKGGTPPDSLIRGYPRNVIILDDDDASEDVRQTRNLLPYSGSWVPELTEQDLELRLGLAADYFRYPPQQTPGTDLAHTTRNPYAGNKKAKTRGGEVKLRCSICMDVMKEETSTICGHVFCRACITSAVVSQKKCPSCRMKLSLQHIHRIYLPASTS